MFCFGRLRHSNSNRFSSFSTPMRKMLTKTADFRYNPNRTTRLPTPLLHDCAQSGATGEIEFSSNNIRSVDAISLFGAGPLLAQTTAKPSRISLFGTCGPTRHVSCPCQSPLNLAGIPPPLSHLAVHYCRHLQLNCDAWSPPLNIGFSIGLISTVILDLSSHVCR